MLQRVFYSFIIIFLFHSQIEFVWSIHEMGRLAAWVCTGKALLGWTVIHKAWERKEKTEEKPVSLSASEVKWMCNLLSRDTHCKQKSCVHVVVDCESWYVKWQPDWARLKRLLNSAVRLSLGWRTVLVEIIFLTTVVATTVKHLPIACVLIY